MELQGHEAGCGMIFCGGVFFRSIAGVVAGGGRPWCGHEKSSVVGVLGCRPFRPGIIVNGEPIWNINRGKAAWPGAIRVAGRADPPPPCQN